MHEGNPFTVGRQARLGEVTTRQDEFERNRSDGCHAADCRATISETSLHQVVTIVDTVRARSTRHSNERRSHDESSDSVTTPPQCRDAPHIRRRRHSRSPRRRLTTDPGPHACDRRASIPVCVGLLQTRHRRSPTQTVSHPAPHTSTSPQPAHRPARNHHVPPIPFRHPSRRPSRRAPGTRASTRARTSLPTGASAPAMASSTSQYEDSEASAHIPSPSGLRYTFEG